MLGGLGSGNSKSNGRMFQNKRVYFDESKQFGGEDIMVPSSHIVYKDLVSKLTDQNHAET